MSVSFNKIYKYFVGQIKKSNMSESELEDIRQKGIDKFIEKVPEDMINDAFDQAIED